MCFHKTGSLFGTVCCFWSTVFDSIREKKLFTYFFLNQSNINCYIIPIIQCNHENIYRCFKMSLLIAPEFQHILRVLNTNIDGKEKIMYALTSIKGVGRRYSNIVLKKADIDITKRAGEITDAELERIMEIIQNPQDYKIPNYFLNRKKDIKDGKYSQVLSNQLDNKLREDLERLKKIRSHRGLRHYWGLRVRGQHTKTTGRKGRTVGVAKKK